MTCSDGCCCKGSVHPTDSSKSSSFADVALSTTMLRLATPLLLLATAHGALELTEDNWNSALAGKSAFVKFLAPW